MKTKDLLFEFEVKASEMIGLLERAAEYLANSGYECERRLSYKIQDFLDGEK